jgi:beta-barrel assembly-enhancing protease
MNAFSRYKSSALALVVVASLSGCGSSGGGGDFNVVSIEDEWRMGEQIAADIARQAPIVNDAQANAYINAMGQALVRQSSMANLPWKFHIIQDPSINAFNIPGGHVYIHTGLIAAASNASELAGVMAHEINHGVERHATEQMSKQYGLEIIAALALGQNPGALQQVVAQVLGTGALARFSREAEEEADRLAVPMMARAGYNANGLLTMFQKLLAERKSRPGSVERFFSTHPLTEERIKDITSEIQKQGVSGGKTDEPEFQSLKSRVTS